MTRSLSNTGRGYSRPVLVAVLGILGAGGALVAARAASSGGPDRGPIALPNSEAQPPVERVVVGVRFIEAGEAPERLVLDTIPPTESARLLWFQGRAAQPLPDGGSVVLDGAGGIVRFDERLRVHRVRAYLEGRTPVGTAPAAGGGLWVADAAGELVRVGEDGYIVETAAAPFDFPQVHAGATGEEVWLVRSSQNWSYRLAKPNEPLLARLGRIGSETVRLGSIRVPQHVLLAELANAGHLAVGAEAVYFAPFIRDEVVALTRHGDTLWIAQRGLPQSVEQPKFVVEDGQPMIDYAPVNLGMALGPDGRLYVLSVPGFTTQEARLDVFDPGTGQLVRTAHLDGPDPTLAVDEHGRTYSLDAFRLMTGVSPREREAFPPFDLSLMEGGRMQSSGLLGKVVLINFWASWCAPCREEMPALDSLNVSIAHPDFVFLTLNDDVASSGAKEFVAEFGFEFPVLMGGGKLRAQYHYIGLPTTVLLDRDGRLVQQWIGFAGEEQIQGIRAVVEAELAREGDGDHQHASGSQEHGGVRPSAHPADRNPDDH